MLFLLQFFSYRGMSWSDCFYNGASLWQTPASGGGEGKSVELEGVSGMIMCNRVSWCIYLYLAKTATISTFIFFMISVDNYSVVPVDESLLKHVFEIFVVLFF